MAKHTGTETWFNEGKSLGFIAPDDGKDGMSRQPIGEQVSCLFPQREAR